MTVSLVYELTCDRCGTRYVKCQRYAGLTRHAAREEGWTSKLVKDGREDRCVDSCPGCTATAAGSSAT